MALKIIAGRWRGRALKVPPGETTRPTAARARQALFSMLTSRIGTFECLRALDLFAGSGALGLEALSRGAAFARFVERDAKALSALRANLAGLGATGMAAVLVADATKLGTAPETYDLVFLDPPYGRGLAQSGLDGLRRGGWLSEAAWIAVETEPAATLDGWSALADVSHGKARLRLLRAGG